MNTKTAVLILAGGKSERMSFPKPFLQVEGKSLLECIAEGYIGNGYKKIVVVLNSDLCDKKWNEYLMPLKEKIKIVENANPELGRFHSIKLGMKHLQSNDFCFIQNADNPFPGKNVIEALWQSRSDSVYSSPVYKGKGGHPVLVPAMVIHHINTMNDGDYNLNKVLEKFQRKDVEVSEEAVLMNINTPEDYAQFLKQKFA